MDKSQEQELRDKIKELEDQLDMVKREHAFDDVATQMFAMKQAFMKVGFTEEQAQEFVMLNMKAGLR